MKRCTNLPAGAVQVCGRRALWHVQSKGAARPVGWLCASCGIQWQHRGQFSAMHTVGQACDDGTCSLAQVA